MSLWFIPGYLGTATEFGTVQTVTVTSTDHGNLGGLGDDDHPQYGALAENESVIGAWTFTGAATFGNTATVNDLIPATDNTYRLGRTTPDNRRWIINAMTIFCDEIVEFVEIADPSAPGTNRAKLYVRDTGGKTQLVVRFNTGAVQVIATEP